MTKVELVAALEEAMEVLDRNLDDIVRMEEQIKSDRELITELRGEVAKRDKALQRVDDHLQEFFFNVMSGPSFKIWI